MPSRTEQAAAWRRELNLQYHIGVDGGVDFKTAPECAAAGADAFISGTALFGLRQLRAGVRKMRNSVVEAAEEKAKV